MHNRQLSPHGTGEAPDVVFVSGSAPPPENILSGEADARADWVCSAAPATIRFEKIVNAASDPMEPRHPVLALRHSAEVVLCLTGLSPTPPGGTHMDKEAQKL